MVGEVDVRIFFLVVARICRRLQIRRVGPVSHLPPLPLQASTRHDTGLEVRADKVAHDTPVLIPLPEPITLVNQALASGFLLRHSKTHLESSLEGGDGFVVSIPDLCVYVLDRLIMSPLGFSSPSLRPGQLGLEGLDSFRSIPEGPISLHDDAQNLLPQTSDLRFHNTVASLGQLDPVYLYVFRGLLDSGRNLLGQTSDLPA